MSAEIALHERLVARQSTEELERKRRKAWRRAWLTTEDIDFCRRLGAELHAGSRIE